MSKQPEQAGLQGPTPRPVPVLTTYDAEQFEQDYWKPQRPVLYRGVTASWPAVKTWTPQQLVARFGHVPVEPSVDLPETEVPYQFVDVSHRQKMDFETFVARLESLGHCYLDQASLNLFPGLTDDFDFGPFEVPKIAVINFWLGANTRSGMHYDHVDNLFAQIYGVKEVRMLPPGEMRNLYPFPDCHTKSRVAPEHPDLRAHPRYAQAEVWSCRVEPGDILFVPRCWWHYFRAPEVSISINCWFGNPLTPAEEAKMVLESGRLDILAQTVVDFVRYGLLKRPYHRRLFSPAPTGVWVHDFVSQQVAGLLKRGRGKG